MKKTLKTAHGTDINEATLQRLTRGDTPAGICLAVCVIDHAARKGQSPEAAAHQCGVLHHQFVQLLNGTLPLDALTLRTLCGFATYLDVAPFVLTIAAGSLRRGDFETPGTVRTVEPYAGEWSAWLQSDWVGELRVLVETYGLPADGLTLPRDSGSEAETRGAVIRMHSSPAGTDAQHFRSWVADTLKQRTCEPTESRKALGLGISELGRLLHGKIDPREYSRRQLCRFAAFLGVPVVAVLGAMGCMERPVASTLESHREAPEPDGRQMKIAKET